jgi:hypothetical protein
MFIQTEDGSVVDEAGKLVYFSAERFIRDIVEGDCCFICGRSPSETPFNREHVLPDWILSKYQLYSDQIVLPNGKTFRYDQYTLACCKDCNSLMSVKFETPISALLHQGYRAGIEHLKEEGPFLLSVWLTLIFLKTHLKDKTLRWHLDSRKGEEKIAERYAWEELHHLHCVARSFYTGAELDGKVLGTLFVLPAKLGTWRGDFDFRDDYGSQTILLRMGEVALLAVLNDAGGAISLFGSVLQRVTGTLGPTQLREVAANLSFTNINLSQRPQFLSELKPRDDRYVITADVPAIASLRETTQSDFGEVMYAWVRDIVDEMAIDNRDQVKGYIKEGRYSFLFDPAGNFIKG